MVCTCLLCIAVAIAVRCAWPPVFLLYPIRVARLMWFLWAMLFGRWDRTSFVVGVRPIPEPTSAFFTVVALACQLPCTSVVPSWLFCRVLILSQVPTWASLTLGPPSSSYLILIGLQRTRRFFFELFRPVQVLFYFCRSLGWVLVEELPCTVQGLSTEKKILASADRSEG